MPGFEVVVRVARLSLECSAEGVEVLDRSVAAAASAYGVEVDLVVLPEQVLLTERSSGEVARAAVVRAAPGIFRLDQVAALKRFLVRVQREPLDPEEACRLLDAISQSRPRWPAWARVLGVALFAAGFAPSVVATWSEAGAAALLGLLMGALVIATAGRPLEGLLPFFGAFIVTVVGLTVLSGLAEQTGVTLMVLPALFIVVPGDTLSAAAGELLGGRLTAGSVRLIFGFLTLGLIVIGIVAAAGVTGNGDALVEKMPPPELPLGIVLVGWVVFSLGLVLAFNAEPRVLVWLVPGVIGTFLLQQGITRLGGAVIGTLVAGAVLGACANLVSVHPGRPPRLILLLGGFFVLTVGGVGVRGATSLLGGDIVTGLQSLADFALQVPTVALALAAGVIVSDAWRRETRVEPAPAA
ncbi:threonine/serine exporter family protein [Nocardioides guangzhouensis]|uniref:Threonine/serine exporter family protein n=1 Tax=Nocardioides guangzhouensis TaxID=2497878 RepID=A0A4Q4ZGH6_9ACTN|nr:threonine/serine exporter family protein [Nocardioides guangzhouensis]RYP86855.1 threonine/serine exporter family protein [Nocardioides guangzhouensis]